MIGRPGRGALAFATAVGLLLGVSPPAVAQEPGPLRLTLGDAARLAAERGFSVLQARARTERAGERVREATADLLPHVEASVAWGARTFNTASFGLDFPAAAGEAPLFDPEGEVRGPVRSADVRALLELPLLDFGALGRRRAAQADAATVRVDERVAAEAAAGAAARAYLGTLRAEAGIAAREEDLALALELVGVARDLVDAGVGVALDVTRAEAQVATVRAQLLSAEHQADIAGLALGRALRLTEGATVELIDSLGAPPAGSAPSEPEAVMAALERRPELARAVASRAAADETLAAVRAARLPRLAATVDDGFYGGRFGRLLNTYTWTLSLSVPVFDGFARSARAGEQKALVREIDYRIDDLREGVAFQVQEALLNLAAAGEQAAAAGERVRLAQLEFDQEQEQVLAGVAGTADVVRAAMRLNEARTGRLDALWASHIARLDLAVATGTVVDLP